MKDSRRTEATPTGRNRRGIAARRRPGGAVCVLGLAVLLGIAGHGFGEEVATAMRFVDASKESGVSMTLTCGRTPSKHILEVDGGGVALFDFDNDGDLDLFLANGATMDDPEHGPGSRLYLNRGDGTFEDASPRVGLKLTRWAMGVAIGDYDGDGWDDIYVACFGPNVLLHNEAGKHLVDVTERGGVGDGRWATSAAFGDVDGDGDLDLYVVNYLAFDVKSPPDPGGKTFLGVSVMAGPAGLTPQGDVLYLNEGDGTFKDVTESSGCVPQKPGYGLGVRIIDYDGDADQDIFVGNDSTENFLFRNDGSGKFKEIGALAGVSANYDGVTQATMGIAVGDLDNNGYADLFSTNFSSDTNTVHLNLGDGFFDDRTAQYGLAMISRPFLSWGCGYYDFDSDGDEDLFIASGHVYPVLPGMEASWEYEQALLLFARTGKRFDTVSDAGAIFDTKYSARATAFGDIDNDGDVDIVMTTLNGPVYVFRNESPLRDVLVVALSQRGANHRAYGSKVELSAGDNVQRRWITGGGSYQSVDAPAAYFGLGDASGSAERKLKITWPDGKTNEVEAVPVNRKLIVHRGADRPESVPLRGRGS